MLSANADPWDVAKREVASNVKNVEDMHAEWQKLLHTENTASNKRFQYLHAEVVGELTQLGYDLQDCTATIECVERDPSRYNVNTDVIAGRKDFVKKCRTTAAEIKESVDKAQTKIDADKRQFLLGKAGASGRGSQDAQNRHIKENDSFIVSVRQDQERIISQQDEALDELSKSAQRLGHTARTINVELQDQQKMLAELGDDIDKEAEKLNFVMKRMGRLLQTSDKGQLCLIIGLMILAVVLIFLIINT